MWEVDAGVVLARWESGPAASAVAAIGEGLDAFAAAHGMSRGARRDVRAAVSEAVTDALGRLRRDHEPGSVCVDAATDGVWLSVQVTDRAGMRGAGSDEALPVVHRVPHRLERAADATGTYLMMEFAMRPDGPALRR
jgi:hypothetical protein